MLMKRARNFGEVVLSEFESVKWLLERPISCWIVGRKRFNTRWVCFQIATHRRTITSISIGISHYLICSNTFTFKTIISHTSRPVVGTFRKYYRV